MPRRFGLAKNGVSMNVYKIKNYIEKYKSEFDRIHDMEIYKWKAVKQFQDSFDLGANNFHAMLTEALSKTYNLMDSGQYFPRRMILRNAKETPDETKDLFQDLFDQSVERIERIQRFSKSIKDLNSKNFGQEGLKDYQDDRAIIVYLNLKYPEDNYFYKFGMFSKLVDKIDYYYSPKRGDISNVIQFYSVCDIIKDLLKEDNELIKLHHGRLGKDDYSDINLNILTQDFIYALTNHLELNNNVPNYSGQLKQYSFSTSPKKKKIKLSGSHPDYQKQAKTNKRIGDLGELRVLQFEIENANPKYVSKISHDSKEIGDGLGYDILSYDSSGNPKYIEVKTTKGGVNTPFYITTSELKKSILESENYYLYRVYNYNDKDNSGDLYIISGNLSEYCINPIQFEVILQKE